jgi:predicted murein hydrolase (TIGR00659 family)
MRWTDPVVLTLTWSAATVALYGLAKAVHRRWPRWWTTPLTLTPLLLAAVALAFHVSYRDYSRGAHWLVLLLGPATVAFAVPIYQQRALIRRHWPVLAAGVAAGSGAAIASAWALASLFGLSGALRLSLLPRSISTPFAMTVSGDIGGTPELTAIFVVFTGVFGAALGEAMLHWLPLRSTLARGALFGMGAHGAGVAKAHQIGREEGSVAGLVMVLVGLVNVLAAPLLALVLR